MESFEICFSLLRNYFENLIKANKDIPAKKTEYKGYGFSHCPNLTVNIYIFTPYVRENIKLKQRLFLQFFEYPLPKISF